MKNYLFIFVFSFISTLGSAQDIIQIIKNEWSPAHQRVEGTKISLVPPEGFEKSPNFKGFLQKSSTSSLMITEMPGPYAEMSAAMTAENMLTRGVELKSKENIQVKDRDGLLLKGEQLANGIRFIKYIMLFGNATETVMINAVFPETAKENDAILKKSLFSLIYDAERTISPFEGLDYSVDISNTKFKFTRPISNSVTCTVDGNLPPQSVDKSFILITKSISEVETDDKKGFCQNRLRQLPIDLVEILSVESIELDNIAGFEITALAKDKKTGADERVIQTIVFDGKSYYLFFGSCDEDFDGNLALFHKVFKTFKRK